MKKNDTQYDIFISYRRDNGWDTAKHLRDILTARGYSVFFDVDSLRSGDFNRALLDVIKHCTDFIIILSPNALDRCVNEGDWVRQELACALEAGKNVIPVISGKFHFPEKLPEDINAVRWKNAITVNIEFFDAMVEKLVSFLHSKPHKPSILRWLVPAAVVCLAAVVMILQPWKKQVGEPSPVPEAQATPAQVATTQTENAQPEVSGYENNVLISDIFPSTDWFNAEKWTVFGSEITRGEIGSVTFLDTLENATENAWDVSQYGDGSVKAWTEKNGELYDLYIAGKGGVCAPADCSVLFSGYRNAKSINFGNAFHTEKTVDMRYMFSICESLRGLNLSTFRTENVTDMNSMFQYCSNLQVLDISSFSTSAVKNMGRMFMECRALAMLDLSEFDTARVTDMADMFFRCSSLRELDLSSFIMSKVTDISGMFFKCASITDLKLSRFDTAMDQLKRDSLFEGCTMLSDVYFDGTEAEWSAAGLGETLPESATVHFAQTGTVQAEDQPAPAETDSITPKASAAPEKKDSTVESAWTGGNVLMVQIISMEEAFSAKDLPAFGGEITRKEIGSISFLDTLENKPDSAWDVSENQDGTVMAWAVPDGELYHLYIAGEGGVSAPEDCSFLFCGYTEVETFEFGNAFHTDGTDKMNRMFFNDVSIGVLDLNGFHTENVTQMISMFDGCISLRALDLGSFDTSNVTNMLSMFDDCRSLIKLDLSGFDTGKVKYMDYMFKNCRTLKDLDVSLFDISHAESLTSMFQDCAHLKSLNLGRFDTAMFPHTTDLFTGCDELTDVYYSGKETDWEDAGLGETLPESATVHFA